MVWDSLTCLFCRSTSQHSKLKFNIRRTVYAVQEFGNKIFCVFFMSLSTTLMFEAKLPLIAPLQYSKCHFITCSSTLNHLVKTYFIQPTDCLCLCLSTLLVHLYCLLYCLFSYDICFFMCICLCYCNCFQEQYHT